MNVPTWIWLLTVGAATVFLLVDVFVIGRRPHEPSMRESAQHLALFVAMAVAFGLGVWAFAGGRYATASRVIRNAYSACRSASAT